MPMSSIKCKYCGLANFADATICARCKTSLHRTATIKNRRGPRSFSYVTLLIVVAIAAGLYYLTDGFQKSMNEVNANEAKRVAAQPKNPDAGLSRTEYDQKRSGQYGGAVQNSNSFSENQKHNEEIQKMMNASQGSQQK